MSRSSNKTSNSTQNTLQHVAIIMDGNGRWAKRKGRPVSFGHRAGVEVVREVLEACEENNIKVLTLFAFSRENWQRPEQEVSGLMRLFLRYLSKEVAALNKNGVRLRFIGARENFEPKLLKQIESAEQLTKDNTKTTLVLAVDYGGDWDIAQACKSVTQQVLDGESTVDSITPELIGQHVCLADLPAPDLCIRTSGECRISNFLLWQLAYSEFYFSDVLWPDFNKSEFVQAIDSFNKRQRRYGGRSSDNTASQVLAEK